jgi:hypothetical protein
MSSLLLVLVVERVSAPSVRRCLVVRRAGAGDKVSGKGSPCESTVLFFALYL